LAGKIHVNSGKTQLKIQLFNYKAFYLCRIIDVCKCTVELSAVMNII